MTTSLRRRSLAVRTMAGVVAVVALALAALTVTTLGIAGHVVTSQLHDTLTESWRRTASFISNAGPGPGASLPGLGESGLKNPINAPGLPAGGIAMVLGSDGTVTSAGRIDESGQRVNLGDDAVVHLLDVVKFHDEASTSRGLFIEVDLPFGRYVIFAAPIELGKRPGVTDNDGFPGGSSNFSHGSVESRISGENEAVGDIGAADTTTSEGILLLGISTEQADHTKGQLLAIQLIGSFLALAAVGLGVWWWIRRSLRPLQQVSHVAAKVSEIPMASGSVDLHAYRVPDNLAQPRDEVGDVGHVLNRLLDSVDSALTERAASEAKLRTFVADASHELRTPLASVRGYAEMIQLTEALDENGEKLLQRVLQQSERMSTLVENLLLLARLDAAEEARMGGSTGAATSLDSLARTVHGDSSAGGQSTRSTTDTGGRTSNRTRESVRGHAGSGGESLDAMSPGLQKSKTFDLGELVLDAVMDATAAGRHHEWTADIPDEPVLIYGDASQISQLLGNLLSNARKHTPEGTAVTTQLAVEGDTVVFTVMDTGPGIDPSLISKIFDRFVRGDSARTTSEGSTGLGLSIVRSVAHAHGGDATVTSQPGHTEFRVELPLANWDGSSAALEG